MKFWNIGHRYKAEGSNSPHAINIPRLLKFAQKKLGPEMMPPQNNNTDNWDPMDVTSDGMAELAKSTGFGLSDSKVGMKFRIATPRFFNASTKCYGRSLTPDGNSGQYQMAVSTHQSRKLR
jgi:hypothetical protein